MFFIWSLILLGTILLYFGSEIFVKGITRLALLCNVRPLFIGLWIIAIGTALPELVIGLNACCFRVSELAFGMVIGCNLANIGLIVGLTAVIRPLKIQVTMVRRELPCLILATILLTVLGFDGVFDFYDGIILLTAFLIFTLYLRTWVSKNPRDEHELGREINHTKHSPLNHLFLFVIGFIALTVGGYIIVKAAVYLQSTLSVAPYIIGITVMAMAASVPELIIALFSSFRGHGDLSVGNMLSSNLFQTLFVVGLIALICPFKLQTLQFRPDMAILCGIVLVLFIIQIFTFKLSRIGGSLLAFIYVCYVIVKILPRLFP